MNRQRLKKLRKALEQLQSCADIRNAKSSTGYSGTLRTTDADMLCARPATLPPIDTLDMRVNHAVHTDAGGRTRVVGCICGLVIQMYPDETTEATEATRALVETNGSHDATDVAAHVLELDEESADMLFNGHPDEPRPGGLTITPREASIAVERVMAGIGSMDIWNHVRAPREPDRSQAESNARDFLDRRDEARISHRLGRPFRF